MRRSRKRRAPPTDAPMMMEVLFGLLSSGQLEKKKRRGREKREWKEEGNILRKKRRAEKGRGAGRREEEEGEGEGRGETMTMNNS